MDHFVRNNNNCQGIQSVWFTLYWSSLFTFSGSWIPWSQYYCYVYFIALFIDKVRSFFSDADKAVF